MSSIKLTYFQLKGLGEPIRWLLKYGNFDFEDNRIELDDWPKVKPTTLFGQLPIYEENGKEINQASSICRHIAHKVKLVGDSEWDKLEIDAIVDTVNDLRIHLMKYGWEKDEKIKEKVKGPLFNETLPFYLDRLEKIAGENNGYLAIKKLTWADIYFVGVLDYFTFLAGIDIIENYSNLKKVRENVLNVPAIKSWIKIRPNTPF